MPGPAFTGLPAHQSPSDNVFCLFVCCQAGTMRIDELSAGLPS